MMAQVPERVLDLAHCSGHAQLGVQVREVAAQEDRGQDQETPNSSCGRVAVRMMGAQWSDLSLGPHQH